MWLNAGVKTPLKTLKDGGLSKNYKAKRHKRSKEVLNTVLDKSTFSVVLVTGIYNISYC